MLQMDIWISLVCGSIVWGAAWATGMLLMRAVNTGKTRRGR